MDEVVFHAQEQQDRYERLRSIDWWDQDRLRAARVFVVGAGALGNEVLKNLALLGVGQITVIDFDRIEFSNLTRSVLFRAQDVGAWKAQVVAERVRELNPDVNIRGIVGDLELDIGTGFLKHFDVALGCLDSVNARWALNKACRKAGVPWINGGINATAGEVSFFLPTHSVCYECTMTADMWQRFNKRYSCTKLAKEFPATTMPTTATVASVTAALQVQQALIHLHALPLEQGILPGSKLFISLKPVHSFSVTLPMNPDCLAHELLPESVLVLGSPDKTTVLDVFTSLEQNGLHPVVLELDYDLMTDLECPNCGTTPHVVPVKRVRTEDAICPNCSTLRRPLLIHNIPRNHALVQEPLASLGVPNQAILRVQTDALPAFVEFAS